MRRFWLEPESVQGNKVHFSGNSLHHLVNVSRFGEGDEVEVLFGADHALKVKIASVSKKEAVGEVLGQRALPQLQRPHIHLVIGLPRPAVFDATLEKAVELGCAVIQPVISDHSQSRDRSDRWVKIVKSATEQSGRADLMEVREVSSLKKVIDEINPKSRQKGLFLYEGESALDIRSALQQEDLSQLDELWAFVGPEGGFSSDELKYFEAQGLQPTTMGGQILRVETACVAILSVLKYELEMMC